MDALPRFSFLAPSSASFSKPSATLARPQILGRRLGRTIGFSLGLLVLIGSLGASYRTANFVVTAETSEIARQVGDEAERLRSELSADWLGEPLPKWSQPCPITVQTGERMGAGGVTTFVFDQGEVFGWRMSIQGTLERVLDSVLPHEITHTIFASYFRQPLPRWADEGACTTVEHESERRKQQSLLIQFLRTGHGIPFSGMFAMKQYPPDVLPLYAQGHSLATFLLAQKGKREFLAYIGDGLKNEQWSKVTKAHYGYENLRALQEAWLAWVKKGSPRDLAEKVAKRARRPERLVAFEQESENRPGSDISRELAADQKTSPDDEKAWRLAQNFDSRRGANFDSYLEDPSVELAGPLVPVRDQGDDRADRAARADRKDRPTRANVTRPQPAEPQKEVVVEWDRSRSKARPRGSAAKSKADLASQPDSRDPARVKTSSEQPVRRSVYDVRGKGDRRVRR